MTPGDRLQAIWKRAVAAVHAGDATERALPELPAGDPFVVLALGKAAHAMASRVESCAPDRVLGGLVVTKDGHGGPLGKLPLLEAGHPVPDERSERAAREALRLAAATSAEQMLLVLLSGGTSALTTCPAPGLGLEDLARATEVLLACGADIHDINTVRKHLSDIKGGRLAAAAFPARTVTLAISDVPGNDPATIASGPTVGDPTTRQDALEILSKYGIKPPSSIAAKLASITAESPFPGDPKLIASEITITATAAEALEAAMAYAKDQGREVVNLGDKVEGLASALASEHAKTFERERLIHSPGKEFVLISGGEATVALQGRGKGGPNQEYLLALAIALDGRPDVFAIAADTDGIDGASQAAGAFITPNTLTRATAQGLDPHAHLARNDAGGFFEQLGDLIITGPTCTNVNDFRAIAYIPSVD